LTPLSRTKGEATRVLRYLFSTIKKSYYADYHVRLLQSYVESIRDGTDPPVSIEDALPTIRLLEELKTHASPDSA
jgi:predicted dehydrogenase